MVEVDYRGLSVSWLSAGEILVRIVRSVVLMGLSLGLISGMPYSLNRFMPT